MRSFVSTTLFAISLALFTVGIAVSQTFADDCCCCGVAKTCPPEDKNVDCPVGEQLSCDPDEVCTELSADQGDVTKVYCTCVIKLSPPPGC